MIKNIEMDKKVPLSTQLQQNVNGGVVLIITYTVNPDDEDQFIKTWTSAAEITKKTSGIISFRVTPEGIKTLEVQAAFPGNKQIFYSTLVDVVEIS